jgi:hypothetical protein
MSENLVLSDPNPSALVAFLDRVTLELRDRQGPPEPEPPKASVQPESRIVLGRGIRRAA